MFKTKTNVKFERERVNGDIKIKRSLMKFGGMLRGGDLKSNASNFKKILFFLCFIVGGFFALGVGEASAATYYVSKDGGTHDAGSNTAPYDTWAKAATSINTVVTYIKNSGSPGNVVYLDSDTFNGSSDYILLDSSNHANLSIEGSGRTDTIIKPAEHSSIVISSASANNVLIENATIEASGVTRYGVLLSTSSTGISLVNLNIISQSNATQSLIWNSGGGLSIRNTHIYFSWDKATAAYPVYYSGGASGVIENTISMALGTSDFTNAWVLYGTGITTVNKSIILDSKADGILHNYGTVDVRDSLISGGLRDIATYPLRSVGGTAIAQNNYLIGNSFYGNNHWVSGFVDTNNIKSNEDPKPIEYSRKGYIIPHVDDSGNFSYAEQVADKLNLYGFKGTFYLEGSNWDFENNNDLRNMVSGGVMEVANHSWSHTNLTTTHAINISQTGGVNCSASFNGSTINLDCDGSDYDQIIDTTDANNDTLGEIVTRYSSVKGWTLIKASSYVYDKTKASSLLISVSTTVPCSLDFDLSGIDGSVGLIKDEIFDSKTWLTSLINENGDVVDGQTNSAFVAQSFGYPNNSGTEVSRAATINANYTNARYQSTASIPTSIEYVTNLDLFSLGVMSDSYLGTNNEETTRERARALAFSVAQSGMSVYVLSHNTSELSMNEWDWILDEWNKFGDCINITSSQLFADDIRSVNWTDNGDGTYFRNFDYSNYYPQSTSPLIDAGTNISLTSDFDGNPIYGLPDIGAYEYQPPYDMGTDEVDISANARIYGDGKFRNTETAGGTTADLSIIPQDSQTTKWLDISKADDEDEIIWEANHKKWKESSTTLGVTETLHTVGDLTAGKAYSLRIDDSLATANITGTDCSNGICTANELGKITFTYTGGYSDHTFDITDDVAPIITITSPETGDTVSGDDTLTFTNTEPTNPQCSIDNSTWVSCTSSVTSFSDLTNWDDIAESETFTLYMRDTDGADNTGTANTANLTKADTQAPVRSDGLPSSELSSDTTSTTLSLTTSEAATCKYSTTSGTAYTNMTSAFADVNGTAHSATINGLTSGNSYNYYVRCQDESENSNDTDYLISFSIASAETTEENTDNEKDLNIHNVKTESTENTITITWKTDHNTKSTIRYGTNKNLKEKKKDKDKEKKHKVVLKNLLPNTQYYFRIKAEDSNDNEDSSRIHSIATKSLPVVATSNQNVDTKTEDQNSKMQESESQPVSTSSENITPNICSYTVQQDDTLWSIAKQVYGDATAYPQIIEKNKDNYPDIESKLSIGQELKLCDNSQKQENLQNNSNSQNPDEQKQVQPPAQKQPETKTFQWWNPWSWF